MFSLEFYGNLRESCQKVLRESKPPTNISLKNYNGICESSLSFWNQWFCIYSARDGAQQVARQNCNFSPYRECSCISFISSKNYLPCRLTLSRYFAMPWVWMRRWWKLGDSVGAPSTKLFKFFTVCIRLLSNAFHHILQLKICSLTIPTRQNS